MSSHSDTESQARRGCYEGPCVISSQGHCYFTTQLRRQAEQEQIPRAGPGAGTESRQSTDKLALGEARGKRADIDIATTAVSGKTERRTGLNGLSFLTVVQQGGNGVKVYNWNDAFLSPANASDVLLGS